MISNSTQITKRDERVSALDPNELKNSLMKLGYFAEANIFPPIYKITVKENGDTSTREAAPVNLFVTKSSQKWRDFKLLKPENYMRTVNILIDNYEEVRASLLSTSKILSYSTPVVYENQSERPGKQISNWVTMQSDMLSASSQNRLTYLVEVDIQNCYDTLYTHAIEWALGKRLGKKLDASIRSGNKKRTHGLPVGPYVSDILAEVVLTWIDRNIEKALNNTAYLGYRFKDNYYFLCRGQSEGEKILSVVAEQLRNSHFSINDSKTNISLYTEYHLSMWQTDHKLLIQSLGLKTKNANFTNEKLQVFIDQSLKISKRYNNSNNVLEKTIKIICDGNYNGIIHYDTLFYSVTGMLPLRTLSYPKILSYLKKLAYDYPIELEEIYKTFVLNEIQSAYERKDTFALLWLAYIVNDTDDSSLKDLAAKKLNLMRGRNKVIKDMLLFISDENANIDLWGVNKSRIILSRNEYLNADALYGYLGISFGES